MKKYSEFINFPIYLWASKEVDVEVPADEDESTDEEETSTHHLNDIIYNKHYSRLKSKL